MWAAGHGNLDSTPPLTPNIAGILGPFSGSDSSGYPALALSSQTQAMVTSWTFCFFAFVFLGEGLDSCLLYNVMNLHP